MNWIFNDLKIEDFNNDIAGNSQHHFYMGRKWRLYGIKNNYLPFPLLYSSLEFRLCIERLVFEIYFMLSRAGLVENAFSPQELERVDNSFISMVNVINEHAGNRRMFRKYFLYCKHHATVLDNIKIKPSIPDLNLFARYWRNLSNFLHYTQQPNDTWSNKDWINTGYEKLAEIENYIYSLMFDKNALVTVQIESLPDELKDIMIKFLDGEINQKQLVTRMELMRDVIARRGLPGGKNRLIF